MIEGIVFLGNPGQEYTQTRHNIGWLFADLWTHDADVWKNKFKGEISSLRLGSNRFQLLKPQTFMNRSGESVSQWLQFYKMSPENILAVHDDLEMDFGEAGIKKGGGLAGHNGLRSVARQLGTQEFYRFRLGISRPARGNVSSYVLSAFNKNEKECLQDFLMESGEWLTSFLTGSSHSISPAYAKKRIVSVA